MNTAHLMVIDRLVDAMMLRSFWRDLLFPKYGYHIKGSENGVEADKAVVAQVKSEILALIQSIFKDKHNGWNIDRNIFSMTGCNFTITDKSGNNDTYISIYASKAGGCIIRFNGPLINGYNPEKRTKLELYGDAYKNKKDNDEKKKYLSTALNLPA